ncbi:exodeoxyribonuclease VII large subunit [Haploplasma modicum]|uniref:exodeoxyribonuclease VII large subunit n=1 Tax=Haploplasma modicum TaxID=2150 RepID=UPI00047EDC6F|nr:exodeoxyribonuclease VII large subunit [Haploplasma modicum]
MLDTALTVSQLTYKIKYLLENENSFKGFVLKGEISNLTNHRSGHLYFALKDENAQIKAIMFQSSAQKLKFKPKDGDKVIVTGSITLYAPQGSYSIQVNSMSLSGAGELYLKYLELKDKLKNLGWFDKPKRELPKYPKTIGVVTSPTGAVIEDIKNTINRRYRLVDIILYPALVQGAQSSLSISTQIEKANSDNICDVLIVGRGGGSIEDLWGFNELATISAIYNSKIPVITAIGHETDDTISDLVSDLRAPTPTAAAELATPSSLVLSNNLVDIYRKISYMYQNILNTNQANLLNIIERLDLSSPVKKLNVLSEKLDKNEKFIKTYYTYKLNESKSNLAKLELKLKSLSPKNKLESSIKDLNNLKVNLDLFYNYRLETVNKRLVDNIKKLDNNYQNNIVLKIQKFNYITDILEKVNPTNIMKRGFSLAIDKDFKIITSIKEVSVNDLIKFKFHDGSVTTKVIDKEEK